MLKGKFYFSKIVLVVFVLAYMSTSISSVFAQEKPITLRFNTLAASHSLAGVGDRILKEEIEERTNGRVKVEIYWAQALLDGLETIRGVADGVADMSRHCSNFFPEELAINGVWAIISQGPVEFENIHWVFKACMEEIPEMKDEFLKNNQIPIYTSSMLPMAVSSRVPMSSVEDFENRKMRVSARWVLQMLEAFRAVPVSVPWNDCYMALQTGMIDAVVSNLDALHDTKIDEVGQNILTMRNLFLGTSFPYTINLDTWNSLSEDIQEQILEASEHTAIRYGQAFSEAWDEIIAVQQERGYTVNAMTLEDIAKWENLPVMEKVEEQWIKENEARGIENAREILEKVKEIVKQGIEKENI